MPELVETIELLACADEHKINQSSAINEFWLAFGVFMQGTGRWIFGRSAVIGSVDDAVLWSAMEVPRLVLSPISAQWLSDHWIGYDLRRDHIKDLCLDIRRTFFEPAPKS